MVEKVRWDLCGEGTHSDGKKQAGLAGRAGDPRQAEGIEMGPRALVHQATSIQASNRQEAGGVLPGGNLSASWWQRAGSGQTPDPGFGDLWSAKRGGGGYRWWEGTVSKLLNFSGHFLTCEVGG